MNAPINFLTVDLEEWYVVEALRSMLTTDDWPELPSTVVSNSRRLLKLFHDRQVQTTWFILGWAADRHPSLIAEIADHGHEIACHSYWHRRVDSLDRQTFKEDTERAMEAIYNATGIQTIGYRAPSWSISDRIPWAFEVLAELGFEYDSSIFPIKHDIYGMAHGPREMFKMEFKNGTSLYEFPSSTYRVMGKNVPVSGGGYLRHSPYWYSRQMIRRINKSGLPAMIYVHPWEIDPDPPKVDGLSPVQWFRTYGSTDIFAYKLDRLLSDFRFVAIADYLADKLRRQIGFDRA